MRIYLNDVLPQEEFYPLTTLRSMDGLRVGIFSIRERWLRIASLQKFSLEIVDFSQDADHTIPSHIIPPSSLQLNHFFESDAKDLNGFHIIQKWWDLLALNSILIANDLLLLHDFATKPTPEEVYHIGTHPLMIHEDANIEHCFINTTNGPVILDEGATIMQGAMLRGPVYVGKNSVVKMGAQLYGGANIGKNCVVGGEIKNAVFHAYSNKSHHGYIGDSYIGEWCNLGAGTSNSNVKNTAGKIRVWNQSSKQFETASDKLGFLMGDHVKTAINTSINSGSVLSSFSNLFSDKGIPAPKFVPLFSWGLDNGIQYELDQLLTEISRWMMMKGEQLNGDQKQKIITLYKQHQQ
jgi:hypothetical protein